VIGEWGDWHCGKRDMVRIKTPSRRVAPSGCALLPSAMGVVMNMDGEEDRDRKLISLG
jgi:hypothetical protein